MNTRDLSLEAKLKHSRKQLYQRTKPMQSKHGQETAAAVSNNQTADKRGLVQDKTDGK